jgi:hypothetical protein
VVDQFWGSGEGEAHRKNELHGDVRSVGGESVAQSGRRVEEEERRLHGGGWAPFIAARSGGRGGGNDGR